MLGHEISMTKNKLNILFLIQNVGEPIEENHIAKAMIENDLMEYFSFKQYVSELEATDFIEKVELFGRMYYRITSRGKNALEFFENKMLGSEKKLLLRFIEKNSAELTKYKEVYMDYRKVSDGKYHLEIKLMENGNAFFSMLSELPNKNMCEKMIKAWNKNPSDMYIKLMNIMLPEEE